MAYDTPITSTVSTPQPLPPANAPSDWGSVVNANYFSNIERLGRWVGGTTTLSSGDSPANYFSPVTASSLGAVDLGVTPSPIYVLVHGWAPDFADNVPDDGDVFWWSSSIAVDGAWPSSWAWQSVTMDDGAFTVNPTGMLQTLAGMNPNATLLCYSWVDDSATSDDPMNAYESEANTHANGIRLANALREAINLTFFLNGGSLNLIGHSHGSKVVTVAAATLQAADFPAARLTILDSPEDGSSFDTPLQWNAANFLGSYLQGLNVMDPANPNAGGTFVENVASYYDVMFAQTPNVVGTCLNPGGNGGDPSMTESHAYAAGWYGASATSNPPVGLAMTVPPASYAPYLIQGDFSSTETQFSLSEGSSTFSVYDYDPQPLTDGNGKSISDVVVNAANSQASIVYQSDNTDQYGLAFDVDWTSPQVGDYLVASVTGDLTYTVLSMDGQSAPLTKTTVYISADVLTETATLSVYFVAAPGGPGDDQATLSNFRWIAVPNAS